MPRKERTYYVYILTSSSGTLYTGMTNSIIHRVRQHKDKEHPGFTARYDVNRLVYYEMFGDVRVAIGREKEIKGWTRKKKIALIESQNPKWEDLSQRWGKTAARAEMASQGSSCGWAMWGFFPSGKPSGQA